MQHKDINGNVISSSTILSEPIRITKLVAADPDRSNPTRPRLERPLDTIRSFEAAIDGSYTRRFSSRPGITALSITLETGLLKETVEGFDAATAQSRRSSYFMGMCSSYIL